jgi:D-glycero-D-manno-heptose 1,7-bisphosphate phosphatase
MQERAMKLVILERDGTINHDGDPFITSPEDWAPLPGALDAIARLNHAGFHVAVASNQPGLGRGLIDVATLNTIHSRMHKMLAAVGARVDAVFFCPHTAEDSCTCRKPLAGLVRADRRALRT